MAALPHGRDELEAVDISRSHSGAPGAVFSVAARPGPIDTTLRGLPTPFPVHDVEHNTYTTCSTRRIGDLNVATWIAAV